jgi:thiamine-phosphate pyrophosphorylase
VASSPKAPSPLVARPAAAWPRLHAIVDVDVLAAAGWTPAAYAGALLDGGATFLQIRAKQSGSASLLALTDDIVVRAAACGATVIVNDRADVALLSGADGVHVGQEDVPVAAARAMLGPGAIVGVSTHTPAQIAAAAATPATYLAVGPMFGTRTKETGYTAVGTELVREARRATGRPVVAIGGVTLENAREALDAGATMVAVISDLMTGGDPAARVRAYLERLSDR